MSSVLEISNLTRQYGKGEQSFTALNDVSFSIEKGESIAIIGKSGSGKSTLMHLIALLDKPTKGSISLEGSSVDKLSTKNLDTIRNTKYGFVFQQFFLNGNDTVLNNVILPLKIAGMSKKLREEKGLKALKEVDLSDKAKNRANDLSGGQKQRVCIARALINNPQVIFADEPTGNLDTATGDKITKLLFDLNKKKNITLIVVTHDPDLAKLCDRQIRIIDGHISKESK